MTSLGKIRLIDAECIYPDEICLSKYVTFVSLVLRSTPCTQNFGYTLMLPERSKIKSR